MAVIRRYELLTPRSQKSLAFREWNELTCSFNTWLDNRKKEFGLKSIKYRLISCYTQNY